MRIYEITLRHGKKSYIADEKKAMDIDWALLDFLERNLPYWYESIEEVEIINEYQNLDPQIDAEEITDLMVVTNDLHICLVRMTDKYNVVKYVTL